tara:strand:- start:398 stop:865 length:468 start_codon:yes stop_codon:yes gene_type:complete
MKLEITSNFSWTKLLEYMQNDLSFGETINKHITKPIVEDSKRKIREDFVTPPTLPVTLRKRRARKFPPTISDSTLHDTGKLHDSIKMTDVDVHPSFKNFCRGLKNIEMEEYGKYHQLGIGRNKKRKFIDLTIESAEIASQHIVRKMKLAMKKQLS